MDQRILVYIDLVDAPIRVGQLWVHERHGRESMSFEYDSDWLSLKDRFSLDLALKLETGSFHASQEKPVFGAIDDSAPDRWGRFLMRRFERKKAKEQKHTLRTLRETDFLLMVDDKARQGALRFKREEQGSFLTTYGTNYIPPLARLGQLLQAAEHVLETHNTDEDNQLLLAPGFSLGGARPKATVRDKEDHLAIAKFSRKDDDVDVIGWEAVALSLASKAGIEVPVWSLTKAGDKKVLVSRRFDRKKDIRIPFLSAMSAVSAKDGDMHSYLEIAEAIRKMSAAPKEDLKELWRRIVFNVLISNLDDHLRNHAFLYTGISGWRLSPAYDLNPVPSDIKPRVLSTAIDLIDPTASLDIAMDVIDFFDIRPNEAKEVVKEVSDATASWRSEATKFEIKRAQIDRMASAFEHDDRQSK